MMKLPFRIEFNLPFDLSFMDAKTEVIVRLYESTWLVKHPGSSFSLRYSCPVNKKENYKKTKIICVQGMEMKYDESDGLVRLYNTSRELEDIGDGRIIGRVVQIESESKHDGERHHGVVGSLHNIPCNVKWSNSHRVNPQSKSTCIHFSAASAGNMYIIFAEIPNDHSTWFYLQVSRSGVAFYYNMRLMKNDEKSGVGTLGDERLFESYFVCVEQGSKGITMMYGKAPASKQIGEVKASFTFPKTEDRHVSFYTFGTGQTKLVVDDIRIINELPKEIECTENGYEKKDGKCVLKCHEECIGCHQALDPSSCTACKNLENITPDGVAICVSKCPETKAPHNESSICKECDKGSVKPNKGNNACTPCPPGQYQNEKGKRECLFCEEGKYTNRNGSTTCTLCEVGHFNDKTGQTSCKECPVGENATSPGSIACGIDCITGEYSVKGMLTPLPSHNLGSEVSGL